MRKRPTPAETPELVAARGELLGVARTLAQASRDLQSIATRLRCAGGADVVANDEEGTPHSVESWLAGLILDGPSSTLKVEAEWIGRVVATDLRAEILEELAPRSRQSDAPSGAAPN